MFLNLNVPFKMIGFVCVKFVVMNHKYKVLNYINLYL